MIMGRWERLSLHPTAGPDYFGEAKLITAHFVGNTEDSQTPDNQRHRKDITVHYIHT